MNPLMNTPVPGSQRSHLHPFTAHSIPVSPTGWYPSVKRLFDVLSALALLILTGPLILVCLVLVRLTSPGAGIYRQTRVGWRGRVFTIYKIRTMTDNCESKSGALWSKPGDMRITPLGRFLRKTHLDELPQLWNVVRGDMSLVGPRPERPEFVPGLADSIPKYQHRLVVRPGVTGLAQVQLPADTDLESVRRKLSLDLLYIERENPWLDVRLILATVGKILHLPCPWTARFLRLPTVRFSMVPQARPHAKKTEIEKPTAKQEIEQEVVNLGRNA